MVVQLVPLVLFAAVIVLPARTRRIQMFGAVPELLFVLPTLPPVVVRPERRHHVPGEGPQRVQVGLRPLERGCRGVVHVLEELDVPHGHGEHLVVVPRDHRALAHGAPIPSIVA